MAKDISAQNKPWERLQEEGSKPFVAFCAYLELGQERTLAKVGNRLGKSATLIERWSSRFKWSDRLRAFEQHFINMRREAEEKAVRLANVDWGIRLTMHREAIWNDAQALRAKAAEILASSSVKATANDAVRALSVAAELERLALNLPTASGDHAAGMAISNSTVLVNFPENFRHLPKPPEAEARPVLNASQTPPLLQEGPANAGIQAEGRRD